MRHLTEAKNKLALNSLTNDRFLVLEDMVLETSKGDIKFPMGEEIVLGADSNDNLVVSEMNRNFIIEDSEIGKELVENVVCKEEMSDVQYKKLTFVEAKNMRITTPGLIKAVADTDEIRKALKDVQARKNVLREMKETGVELPVIVKEHALSFKDKASRIMENKITSKCETLLVEAIEITETPAYAKNCLMLDTIRCVMDEAKKEHENMNSADDMFNAVNGIEGAEMDKADEEGKMVAKKGDLVMGVFDTKSNLGVFFPQGAFASAEELENAMKDNGFELKGKSEKELEKMFDADKEEKVEDALDEFVADKDESKAKEKLINCGMTDEMAESVIGFFK